MSDSITFSNNFVAEKTVQEKRFPGLFASYAEYKAYIVRFKALAHARDLTAADMLLHAILLGKDPKCGFTPITSTLKLDNGAKPMLAFERATFALLSFETNRSHQKVNLQSARDRIQKAPTSVYAQDNLKRCEEALAKPLPLTVRYGCNLEDPLDASSGLSLDTFKKAAK